jgi:hypothetical protein
MIEWIKRNKIVVIIGVIIVLAIIAVAVYFLWWRPRQATLSKQEVAVPGVPVEEVGLAPPPPQRLSPLPLATSPVHPQQIRKVPRPVPRAASDRDTQKSDLRNPMIAAQTTHDDGASLDLGMQSQGDDGGDLDGMFASSNLPQETEYPEVQPHH